MIQLCAGSSRAFAIVGFVGSGGFGNAIHDFSDTILETGDDILQALRDVKTNFDQLETASLLNRDIAGPMNEAISKGEDIEKQVKDVRDRVLHYNRVRCAQCWLFHRCRSPHPYRQAVMITAFVLCIVLFLFPLFSGIVSFGQLSLVYGID